MTTNTFSDRVKEFLAKYKKAQWPELDDGFYRGKKYGHILPEDKDSSRLNILEPYEEEFWHYWEAQERTGKQTHIHFNHLNSSQAMCFNLFYPLINEKAYKIISEVFGVEVDSNSVFEFEKILCSIEDTNFDFYIEAENKRILFEVKYSENRFGDADCDYRHEEKRKYIYEPGLLGKVQKENLDSERFFQNYQLLRNIFYADTFSELWLVFPKGNENLREKVVELKKILRPEYLNLIQIHYLEDFVDKVLAIIPEGDNKLRRHYELFKEKYLPVP